MSAQVTNTGWTHFQDRLKPECRLDYGSMYDGRPGAAPTYYFEATGWMAEVSLGDTWPFASAGADFLGQSGEALHLPTQEEVIAYFSCCHEESQDQLSEDAGQDDAQGLCSEWFEEADDCYEGGGSY